MCLQDLMLHSVHIFHKPMFPLIQINLKVPTNCWICWRILLSEHDLALRTVADLGSPQENK